MNFGKPSAIPAEKRFLSFNGLNALLKIAKGQDVFDVDPATKHLVNDLIAGRISNMALGVKQIDSNGSPGVPFVHYTQQQFQVLLQVAAGAFPHTDTEIQEVTQSIDLILSDRHLNSRLLGIILETLARRGDEIAAVATSHGSLIPNSDNLKLAPGGSR